MSWQLLAATLPILFIKFIPASGSTIILSYSQVDRDWSCQTVVSNFTSYAPYTQCYSIPPAGSVQVVQEDAYCPVTIYSDPYCNYNAEVAPLDTCESPYKVQSYTVDCHFPSATTNVLSTITTSPTTAAQIPLPSSSRIPTLSPILAPLPDTTSPTNAQPLLAQSTAEALVLITQTSVQSLEISSLVSSSTLLIGSDRSSSMSVPISTTSQTMNFNSTSSLAHSSTKPSPTQNRSTAQAPFEPTSTVNTTMEISTGGAGNGGPNLSIIDQVLLGTIFPAIGVLATVLFGINQWRRKEERKRKRRQKGNYINDISQPVAQSHDHTDCSERPSVRNDPVRRTQDGRPIMHVVLGHDRGPVARI